MNTAELAWQSKAVLLLVLPLTAVAVLLESNWWIAQAPVLAWTTLGISALFGLIVWRLKAGTSRAAATGALITACLMYANAQIPFEWSWLHGGLPPLLTVFFLTFIATRTGKHKKHQMGLAEPGKGRNAAQVSANLGAAALVVVIGPLYNMLFNRGGGAPILLYAAALAALAEAAADTVSSEIGEVFGGRPWMITTLRKVSPGTDGAITVTGTAAGILAAAMTAGVGAWAAGSASLNEAEVLFMLSFPAAVFGLLFDSLLGATLEQKGFLNNDAVNFLSTLSAAMFVLLESTVFAIGQIQIL